MRIVVAATVVAFCVVLSACATGGATNNSAACADMIKPGTGLYSDVYSSSKGTRNCGRGYDFDKHPNMALQVEVKLDPTVIHNVPETQSNDFPPQLGVIVARFDDNVTPTADQPTVNSDWPGRILPGEIQVNVAGQNANAKVFRLDEKATQITMGCLNVLVTGQRGTPTKIIICRTIGKFASDDMVKEKARAIADRDLPAVNP